VAPRAEVAELSTAAYPHIADDNPWSIFCLRTRAGMRKHGIGQQLLTGAINFAFDNGATVIEGYPLDTDDKVAPIFAYPGFRRMFEREGFVKVADTTSVLDGVPRILMRLTHQDR
jgi:acetyltransferase, GNAT family